LVDKTIQRLDLKKICIRTAFDARVERLLAACDLVVFPATTNHFARPIVEAAAMAKPVVASRFPILQELVKHDETGLLVPPGDPGDLANALVTLLRDRRKRLEFGERAYAIAKMRFDATNNTKAIMQLYDDLIAAQRSSDGQQISQTRHRAVSLSISGKKTT
jgi:glycosyltransferase involved in cell wall biosynthesis